MFFGFQKVFFNDIEVVCVVVIEEVVVIIVELVQGEGGINVVKFCYLCVLCELCDQENIVLIFDEIQCGVGCMGELFVKDYYEVQLDIMMFVKGLGNGLLVGVILSNEKVSCIIEFGDYGMIFGGNFMACVVGLAVLEVMDQEYILQ